MLEAVTINICGYYVSDWNEMDLKNPTSINWRKSLVPAPAVIPALIVYSKIVVVKTLVFYFLVYGWLVQLILTSRLSFIKA